MTTDNENVSSIKLPVFSGEEEDYSSWWIRFQSYARVKMFATALVKSSRLPDKEEDMELLSPKTDKDKLSAGRRNILAMAHLTMALQSEALLYIIGSACSDKWPSGLAYVVVEKLKEEYNPSDRVAGVEMKRKLNNVSMSDFDKPQRLFEQLKAIQNQYKDIACGLRIEDMILAVFEKAPKEYSASLMMVEREKGNALTLKDLEDAMKSYYRVKYGDQRKESKQGEVSLSAFQGTCYTCQKKGHKSNQCPMKNNQAKSESKGKESENNNGKKKFKGKCHHCGKEGHKAEFCWDKPENVDKRPSFYKTPAERGMLAQNEDKSQDKVSEGEFLLMGVNLEFAQDDKILEDPNVFIGDTGATSDTCWSSHGFKNVRKSSKCDDITDASGNNVASKAIGNIHGKVCNKRGEMITKAVMKNVVHMPDAKYNLFSLTKRLDEG